MAIDNLTHHGLCGPTSPWDVNSPVFVRYFWSRIALTADDDRCWEWQYSTTCGYGAIKINTHTFRAHRIAWQLANGRAPVLDILHSCDNRLCCNPKHLREGTQKENNQEARDRGQWKPNYGEQNGKAFFTTDEILKIKGWIRDGKTTKEMRQLEPRLDRFFIYHLRHNQTWKHVQLDD